MKTPLALLHLAHNQRRTAVAVAGVAFTVLLIFMQLGFLGAVEATATLFYDRLDFDILLVSRRYTDLNQAGTFSRRQLYRALEITGVASAVPVYTGFHLWRVRDERRLRRQVLIVGVHCSDQTFTLAELQESLPRLQVPGTALTDRLCRRVLGPMGPGGKTTELGLVKVEVIGQFTLGTGFGADGLVVVSDETFTRIRNDHPLNAVSLGLVRLERGASEEAVAAELERQYPEGDIRVLKRSQVLAQERQHWASAVPVGILFSVGVGVALSAGMVFLYQVISSDFRTHAAEYATLKAIGYRKGFLVAVVLQQALILAGLGFAAGLPAALALYALTRHFALVPLFMNEPRIVLVLLLTAGMCSLSGLCCSRRIHTTDPANLF